MRDRDVRPALFVATFDPICTATGRPRVGPRPGGVTARSVARDAGFRFSRCGRSWGASPLAAAPVSAGGETMRLEVKTWRRFLVGFGVAIVTASSLSCSGSPSEPTPDPAPAAQNPPACSVRLWACATSGWGSIAFSSSTRASGIAYNYVTRAEADASAIGYCGKTDCAVVAWFQNACGAIATAPTGQMATGTGSSGDTAQALALATCVTR